VEELAAGGEHPQARAGSEHVRDQRRGVQHLLEVVQNQQLLAPAQYVHQDVAR
jgi:hypothetical protein